MNKIDFKGCKVSFCDFFSCVPLMTVQFPSDTYNFSLCICSLCALLFTDSPGPHLPRGGPAIAFHFYAPKAFLLCSCASAVQLDWSLTCTVASYSLNSVWLVAISTNALALEPLFCVIILYPQWKTSLPHLWHFVF